MIGKTASLTRARKFIQDTSRYIKYSEDAIKEYVRNKVKPNTTPEVYNVKTR